MFASTTMTQSLQIKWSERLACVWRCGWREMAGFFLCVVGKLLFGAQVLYACWRQMKGSVLGWNSVAVDDSGGRGCPPLHLNNLYF